MTKVAHCLGWYFPESSGGTEVYVAALSRELRLQGIDNVIGAAVEGEAPRIYEYEDTPVYRYPRSMDNIEEQDSHFESFLDWLEAAEVQIYHQHSWNSDCGLNQLEAAKRRGFFTILTVHVPTNLCLRGTMMLYGREVCDGKVEEFRCASCWLHGRGMPLPIAKSIGSLPLFISQIGLSLQTTCMASSNISIPLDFA